MNEPPHQRGRLAGAGVLVTRAEHQAESLCRLIAQAGGRPLRFPALEIGQAADRQAIDRLKSRLHSYHLAVFVSPNAVKYALQSLPEGLPRSLQVAAVGRASGDALQAAGCAVDLVPNDRYDSEALLELPELAAMQGRRVVIFRGDGGRPLLGETLRRRGAQVDYVEVYRRLRPDTDSGSLLRCWRNQIDLVTVTSVGILNNLYVMLGESGQAMLRDTPLLVNSERLQQRARELGVSQLLLAQRADDRAIVAAAGDWWADRQHG